MDSDRISDLKDSIDRIERNLRYSLDEINLIKRELNGEGSYNSSMVLETMDGEDELDKLIQEIDNQIDDLDNEIPPTKADVAKKIEDFDSKIVRLRSKRTKNQEEYLEDVMDVDIHKFDYEQIGLQNYIDTKNIILRVMEKSKSIALDVREKKAKLLQSMELGEKTNTKNNNVKKYKDFLNTRLKEIASKRNECIKKISELSDLKAAYQDKKSLLEESLNKLLRYLSNLMLDFSYSKEAVNYYNIGRFYNNYDEIKNVLFISLDKKEDFDNNLVDLLALSYQANVMRYDLKYASSETLAAQKIYYN